MLRSYLLELHHIKTQDEKWAKDKLAYITPVSADHFRLPDNGNGFFFKYISEYGTGHSRAVLLFCKYSWGQL